MLNQLRPPPGILPGAPPDGRAETRFGMYHRELLSSHSITRQPPEPCTESWSLFCYVVPASRLAGRLFPVSSMRGRMPPCLRTNPTFPCAASQPNLYIDSVPSGAFPNSINIYHDYYYILSSIIKVLSDTEFPQLWPKKLQQE